MTGTKQRYGPYAGAMSALEPRVPETAAPVSSESPEPPGGILGAAYRTLSIGIISVVFLIAFEATAVGTAMPVAARELDGIGLYAFAFSSYFTTSLFGMVLSGQWADRRGRCGRWLWGSGPSPAGWCCRGRPPGCGCSCSGGRCRASAAGW